MTDVMMALGDFRFSLPTAAYQNLTRTHRWTWAEQQRVGREAALQYTGKSEAVTLEGVIYPHFKGGLGQVEKMRQQADKAEPLILVDGLGNVWGKYVIEEAEEKQSTHFAQGLARKVDFQLALRRYGEDAW